MSQMQEPVQLPENIVRQWPAQPVTAPTPFDMLSRALQQGADMAVIERLMGLAERWTAAEARKAFDAAMAEARAEIPTIAKNRIVSYGATSYRHEDLAEIARTIDPILGKHGLSYRFRTVNTDKLVTVTCIVSHRDGHFEENSLTAANDTSGSKNAIQSLGSAITYLQRYSLKAALGLAASDDDDGRTTGGATAGPISEEQVGTLQRLLMETLPAPLVEQKGNDALGVYTYRFCKKLGVADLAALPASRFAEAKAAIEAKREAAA